MAATLRTIKGLLWLGAALVVLGGGRDVRAQAMCVNPDEPEGTIFYSEDDNVFQYCDGLQWVALHGPLSSPGVQPCTDPPTTFNTAGTFTYEIPENCSEVTIEVFGAGGSGGESITQRGGERASDGQLLAVAGGGGGGGGIEGKDYTTSRGGGGGYAQAFVTIDAGEILDIWVGGGGIDPNNDTGGNGGVTTPYQGGRGGNRRNNAVNTTVYGGGGGAGAENRGGDSVWGGAGGRGDDGGTCGVSTNGGACANQNGGGGGGFSFSGGTVINGSNGGAGAGAAANGGPGEGRSGSPGGEGLVVITPGGSSSSGPSSCDNPEGDPGDIIFNGDAGLMQGCIDGGWVPFGPENMGGGAGCTNPAKPAGTMMFSGDCEVMQYCNGDEWIAMGKTPGLWTPDELGAQLVAWYDFSGSARVTEIDDLVSAVLDKSGNGNDLAQGTALNRPPRGEGAIGSYQKSLRIDSSNQTLFTTSAPVMAAVNGTDVGIFAVARRAAGSGGGTRPTIVRNNAGAPNFDLYENPDGSRVGVHNGGAIVTGDVLTPGEPRLYGAVRSGTNLRIYNFGTELLNSNSAVAVNPTQMNISGPNTNLWWGGHIGEVIFTSGVLSAANRERIEGYLAHHWWLAAYLPPGHPYKDAPPRDADCN